MPNAIVNMPASEHAQILTMLKGRMSPTRWLSLVVRAHVLEQRPFWKCARPVEKSIRITGHAPDAIYRTVLRAAHHRMVSEAEIIYWIAKAALEKRFTPTDTTGLTDVALVRQSWSKHTMQNEIKKRQRLRERKKKERAEALRLATLEGAGSLPPVVVAGHTPGYRSSIGARVSSKILDRFRVECQRAPIVHQTIGLEDAIIDWLVKRSAARKAAPTVARSVDPAPIPPTEAPSEPAAPQAPSAQPYSPEISGGDCDSIGSPDRGE